MDSFDKKGDLDDVTLMLLDRSLLEAVVARFIEKGIDVNYAGGIDTPAGSEMTPLMIACERRELEAALLLLDAGADVTIKCKRGNTAFVYLMRSKVWGPRICWMQ